MRLLLSVPKDVVRDKVMPFLDFASVWKLDFATMFVPQDFWEQVVCPQIFEDVVITEKVVYHPQAIHWLISRHMHVKMLEFPTHILDSNLDQAASVLTRANCLDFDGCNKVSNEFVRKLFGVCGSLQRVDLGGCSWLVDETLFALADRHVDLTYLNLSDVPQITDAAIQYIAFQCKTLTEVNIDNCHQLGDASILALSRSELSRVSFDNCGTISEATIISLIVTTGDILKSINMGGNRNVGNLTLQTLAHYSPHLFELDVSGCRGIGGAAYVALFQRCSNLQMLSVGWCAIPSGGLSSMCTCVSVNLLHLNLSGLHALSDVHIQQIVSRATKLKVLHLSESNLISNNALLSIAQHLPYLHELLVDLCPLLSFEGFSALFHSCRKMTYLDVSYTGFCNACLREVAEQCSDLEDLAAAETSITDAGIAYLVQHSANLGGIDIRGTAVTETALTNLIANCPDLSYINYQEHMSVSDALLELVKRRKIELKLGTEEGFFA